MSETLPVLLVVEDDFLVRLTLADALADDGFAVLEAADALEALHLVAQRPEIQAMLTDINLPGGTDGFALAQAVRVVRPTLPVVYVSGRYAAVDVENTVPGSRFMAKPFIPSLAAALLRDLMAPGNGEPPPTPSQDCHRPRQ